MDLKFFDGIFEGESPTGVKLCMGVTGGDFWARIGGCRNLYCQQDEISSDPDNIIAVVDNNCGSVSVGKPVGITAGDEYYYMIRCVNGCGDEADDLHGAVRVVFDLNGEPAASSGSALFGAEIDRIEGQRVRLKWLYCPVSQDQECVTFSLYSDGGTGEIDFSGAAGQVNYRGCGVYVYDSEILNDGKYLFCISTHLNSGIEKIMSDILVVDVEPSPVSGLLTLSAKQV